jgi:hypothetical protein
MRRQRLLGDGIGRRDRISFAIVGVGDDELRVYGSIGGSFYLLPELLWFCAYVTGHTTMEAHESSVDYRRSMHLCLYPSLP